MNIHIKEICKIGQGNECCRYLIIGNGFECAKGTDLQQHLDLRVKTLSITARGDNCNGKTKKELL